MQRSSSLVASSPCSFPRLRIGKDRWNDFIAKRSDELTQRLCHALTSFMNDLKKVASQWAFRKLFLASALICEPRGTLRSRQNSPSSKASGDHARRDRLPELCPPTPDERREIRRTLGIPEEALLLGTVARYCLQKDPVTLHTAVRGSFPATKSFSDMSGGANSGRMWLPSGLPCRRSCANLAGTFQRAVKSHGSPVGETKQTHPGTIRSARNHLEG